MGGLFGVVSKGDCVKDVFYGTDYHSHLGTYCGGMAMLSNKGFTRSTHDNIGNGQFRSRFEGDVQKMTGNMGIGCISDTEKQPIIIHKQNRSHLGNYAITTVGRINNIRQLLNEVPGRNVRHFTETSEGKISPTKLISTLIDQEIILEDGISRVQGAIDGSCSLLILTTHGLYAARDWFGRTPLVIGEKKDAYCVTSETCAFPNLGYRFRYELGPGEIMLLTPEGIEQKAPPGDTLRICGFLWVYYGDPASTYEGENVEVMRNRSGAALACSDDVEADIVVAIPDSGIAYAIGYANQAHIPYCRPLVKYPTWPRSFMPQDQAMRDLVARMKPIPIYELIQGKRLLSCEDSIVRATQLRQIIQRLYDYGAKEVHMRVACPPLLYTCKFLNFSQFQSELELAGRRAIHGIENRGDAPLEEYTDPSSAKNAAMVDWVQDWLNITSLKYLALPDMLSAIGLPKKMVCTYCWDGVG